LSEIERAERRRGRGREREKEKRGEEGMERERGSITAASVSDRRSSASDL